LENNNLIKILIADDSKTIRFLLKKLFEKYSDVEVIAEAENGEEAIEKTIIHSPDIITMDIRMPIKNGFEATKEIMNVKPTPILVLSASVNSEDLNITFNAIRAGALDIVEKPKNLTDGITEEIESKIMQKIRLLSNKTLFENIIKIHKKIESKSDEKIFTGDIPRAKTRPSIISIVSSTGGPTALLKILKPLQKHYPYPICIVQHINKGYTVGLVDWLNKELELKIKIAEKWEKMVPGTVYVAPDDHHMEVLRDRSIILNQNEPVSNLRPNGTILLNSVANEFGPHAVGIVLTGMGSDGSEGLLSMKKAGALTIAQDESSSVIFGMPKEAYDIGATDNLLSLEKIASFLSLLHKD
jgi:two-component system, chemotaxis family, protein-glutamate methylesterase/glutaminase